MQNLSGIFGFAFMIVLALVNCSNGTAAVNTYGRETKELDHMLTEIFNTSPVAPGMAIAVVQGDKIIYEKGFGFADIEEKRPVTPDTLFYIASTTKSVTALAATLLDYKGRMKLDASFSAYVPKAKFTAPLSGNKITIRDLLTMSHGIDQMPDPIVIRTAFTGDFTNEQLIDYLSLLKPAPNGREFVYGNLGYNLVGLAIDMSQDKGWKEIIKEEVLEPLGMESTTAYRSMVDPSRLAMPHSYHPVNGLERVRYAKRDINMHAAGGHITSVRDMALYLEAQLNHGRVNGRQVFPAEVITKTHEPQVRQDKKSGPVNDTAWGLGWDIGTYDGDTILHRYGGFKGFYSHLSFLPEHVIGGVVLVNETIIGRFLSDRVSTAVYDYLLEKPDLENRVRLGQEQYTSTMKQIREYFKSDLEKRASRPQVYQYPMSVYTGKYQNELLGTMEWKESGGQLHVDFGVAESDVEVYDSEKDQLRVELFGSGSVVNFEFENARVKSLEMLGFTFKKIQ